MSDDFFPIKKFDHVELYVSNAKQAAHFYQTAFGFTPTAYRGLHTGSREVTSYVLEQHLIRLVISTALTPDHPISRSVHLHGDTVAIMAMEVPDVPYAYKTATQRGATGAIPPTEETDEQGTYRYAAIKCYGDVLIKFVDRSEYNGAFAPGFAARNGHAPGKDEREQGHGRYHGFGLKHIDHIVGNVELGAMNRWVDFFAQTMGFTQIIHFDDNDIATEYSALMSKVMQGGGARSSSPSTNRPRGRRSRRSKSIWITTMAPACNIWRFRRATSSKRCERYRKVGWSFCMCRRRITMIWRHGWAKSTSRLRSWPSWAFW
jgi:4-hydroxyphenylpyruvate dioxygenase